MEGLDCLWSSLALITHHTHTAQSSVPTKLKATHTRGHAHSCQVPSCISWTVVPLPLHPSSRAFTKLSRAGGPTESHLELLSNPFSRSTLLPCPSLPARRQRGQTSDAISCASLSPYLRPSLPHIPTSRSPPSMASYRRARRARVRLASSCSSLANAVSPSNLQK